MSFLRNAHRHLPRDVLTATKRHALTSCKHASSFASGGASTSSVNPEEIAHFSRLSQLWWDERGEFGLLHKMNPVRMEFVRQKVVCGPAGVYVLFRASYAPKAGDAEGGRV